MGSRRASIFAVLLMAGAAVWAQQEDGLVSPEDSTSTEVTVQPSVESRAPLSVQWRSLFSQSFRLLLVEHAFRYATEP